VAVTRKQRFHYYRIASPLVAKMLESIKAVAAIEVPPRYQPRSARDEALRFARTCYDHIAGHLGVAIADALTTNGRIVLDAEGGELTETGQQVLARLGADLSVASCGGRIFCRPCLDWSERRYHLAGHVGAEICRRALQLRWFERERGTRILRLTAAGRLAHHAMQRQHPRGLSAPTGEGALRISASQAISRFTATAKRSVAEDSRSTISSRRGVRTTVPADPA
jgi:hypothetical protein